MSAYTPVSLFLAVFILFFSSAEAQNEHITLDRVEVLFVQDNLGEAIAVLDKEIEKARINKDYAFLSKAISWLGKLEIESSERKSFPKAIALSEEIRVNSSDDRLLFQTYLDLSRLYLEKGDAGQAYEIGIKTKRYALKSNEAGALAEVFYYLAEYSLRLGDINRFENNARLAYSILLQNPTKEFKISARILNYMGALMYLTSKPDSAFSYYGKALDKVGMMDKKPENQLYFPAAIKANMVLLKQSQDKYDEALQLALECISLNNEFLRSVKKHLLTFRVHRNLSLAYRNLASLYEQVGDYDKTYRIAKLAYAHAKENFSPDLLEYFSAVTLLAEAEISKKQFDSAIRILDEAEKSVELMQSESPLLKANLYTIYGSAFFGKKDYAMAKEYYERGLTFHKKAQDELSNDGLFATINLALSYANLGEKDEAMRILQKTYEAQKDQANSMTRVSNILLVGMARSADISNDFHLSLKWSARFLEENRGDFNKATDPYLAEAILLNTKATYYLDPHRSVPFLKELITRIDEVIVIMERRKEILTSVENVNSLIRDHREVFDFAKKINLELFEKTKEEVYLNAILTLHESSIYSTIRARLNLNRTISFSQLPEKTQARESYLKGKLGEEENEADGDLFLENLRSWDAFLDSLKINYPVYYKMRYATIAEPLDRLQQNIAKDVTVIRYFFIEESLFALIATKTDKKLFRLPYRSNEFLIEKLNSSKSSVVELGNASNVLYQQLWNPIKGAIKTERVIILPDRELFNLSFELLTSKKIKAFEEYATSSLMGKHIISYNYSLLLLDEDRRNNEYSNNFVAFAPEFNQRMKQEYIGSISDSINLDKSYLTLLPQPFSLDLAKHFAKQFAGTLYLNEKATKQAFIASAKSHKIIYIGTHAENNNTSPELSRLVFAKNVTDTVETDSNNLYTYEIYNYDLASDLAILTACETGKPTYQPGEGMISFAHAFNYAGSKSILTSLWEIDEQSSTEIIAYFYRYLADGQPKDFALRNAKLDYLANSEGRTLHPQYWAGLVLMGDVVPVSIAKPTSLWVWLIGLLILLIISWIILNFKLSHKVGGVEVKV